MSVDKIHACVCPHGTTRLSLDVFHEIGRSRIFFGYLLIKFMLVSVRMEQLVSHWTDFMKLDV